MQTLNTSLFGAVNMLGLAKRTGAVILQASTSEVYGDLEISLQTESYWGNVNPIGIRSCYDEGKRAAESLFFDYHRQHNVHIKIAIIFNTHRLRIALDDWRVVSNFIVQALKNEPITIYGVGSQTRSFCYVSDLIEGLFQLSNSDSKVTGPITLGNPIEFAILELANLIIEKTNSQSEIVLSQLPSDDPRQQKPDITKAIQTLKWSPKINLDESLLLSIPYFKDQLFT
jgi:UDP-glucuronate decarboxylase